MTAPALRALVGGVAVLATAVLAAELVVIEPALALVSAHAPAGALEHVLRERLAAAAGAVLLAAVGWALWAGLARRRVEERVARERIATVGMIAHDLRGPLTGMLLAADRRERAGDAASEARLAAVVRRECARLAVVADDILELCRPEPDRAPAAAPERIDQLLGDVAERVRGLAGVDVDVRIGEGVAGATVDPRIARALGNVAENAGRHAHGGSVALEARLADGALEIAVVDDGDGFPAGFSVEPFGRGHEGGRAGLGLASARRAMTALGGTVRCRSRRGGGAVVSLRLPGGAAR